MCVATEGVGCEPALGLEADGGGGVFARGVAFGGHEGRGRSESRQPDH